MIQLVVNVNLLREIDERKLINRYSRHYYNSDEDLTNDINIRQNLTKLLDWDINGDRGVPVYCGKYESIKRKDWIKLIEFIKRNAPEIRTISPLKKKKLLEQKEILSKKQQLYERNVERYNSEQEIKKNGGLARKQCTYNGKVYNSRRECMFKEGISQNKLYRYLEKTGQV